MTDLERMVQLFRAGHKLVIDDVQEVLGELDREQQAELIGIFCGFVLDDHDFHNPRPDGRKWIAIFHELLGPTRKTGKTPHGKEEKEDGGRGQGFYRG